MGVLCAAGFSLAALLWHLYVQPDVVLSLLSRRSLTDDVDDEAQLLRSLQVAVGGLVVAAGFGIGAAVAFLAGTQ